MVILSKILRGTVIVKLKPPFLFKAFLMKTIKMRYNHLIKMTICHHKYYDRI